MGWREDSMVFGFEVDDLGRSWRWDDWVIEGFMVCESVVRRDSGLLERGMVCIDREMMKFTYSLLYG